jgi:steroid delta-isomerase-like uncharacterized protein
VTASQLAERFWDSVRVGDAASAIALTGPSMTVSIPPAGISGGREALQSFLESTSNAFPDLVISEESTFTATDGTEVTAIRFEGTQSADWLGIVNQEKFLDVRQVWRFELGDGLITRISAYWDQNQVYRRLAVKRLDHVAIV